MKTQFFPAALRNSAVVALAFSAMVASTPAHATSVFASNLSTGTLPSPDPNGHSYMLDYEGGTVTGVSSTGYNFVFASAALANSTGASGEDGTVKLSSLVTPDPNDTQDHGAFLGLDGDYDSSAVDISVNTVAGQTYTVSFDWAGTQQTGFVYSTTDYLAVALGGDAAQDTSKITVPQQGFEGWYDVTDTFTAATTGIEQLSFLDVATTVGHTSQEPAFALLDNINVSTPSPTPEPNSLLLLSTGLMGLGGIVRSRIKKVATVSA